MMKSNTLKSSTLLIFSTFVLLSPGCTTLSGVGKDNTPPPSALVPFSPEKSINTFWRTQVGSGACKSHLHFETAVYQGVVYTIDGSGQVVATDAKSGKTLWSTSTKTSPSSGPCVQGDELIFHTHRGEVVALSCQDGRCLWQSVVSCQLLAPPVIAGPYVLAKAVDGTLTALDRMTGRPCWNFKHPTPLVILQGDSKPLVANGMVFVGFNDGQFFALSLKTGRLLWQQWAAMPRGVDEVDEMVGIIADPLLVGHIIYVASYQNNMVALSAQTGEILWRCDLSSYENFSIRGNLIVATDECGAIWGLNRFTGKVLWQQKALLYRTPTAPLVTSKGIWVGDAQGYLHLLSPIDGHFMARCCMNNGGFFVQPACDASGVLFRSESGELIKVG